MKTLQKKIKLSDNDSAKVKKWAEHIENKSTTIVLLCHLLRLSGEPYPDFVKLINDIREGFKNIDEVERELLDHLTDEWCGLERCDDADSYEYFKRSLGFNILDDELIEHFYDGEITLQKWFASSEKLDEQYNLNFKKTVA
tara:strand:- start:1132 stop:1554 length:423 start_codon:yes stop_codon:yes gene_type:complete